MSLIGTSGPTINEPFDTSNSTAKSATRPSRPGSSCSMQGHLQVPTSGLRRPSTIMRLTSEVMSEDQAEAIRNYGTLSSAVMGLMKSFSTSDLMSLDQWPAGGPGHRRSASEPALFGNVWSHTQLDLSGINRRLDATSRSCSTWVAVGDLMSCVSNSTSQLPSPQAPEHVGGGGSTITSLDFVLSMNKKIRQIYIKRRLMTTYRALERLSRSQFDLSNTTQSRNGGRADPSMGKETSATLAGDGHDGQGDRSQQLITRMGQISTSDFNLGETVVVVRSSSSCKLLDVWEKIKSDITTLTARDIELQKGKPLSKYERNMMIFNWLQDVDQQQDPMAAIN